MSTTVSKCLHADDCETPPQTYVHTYRWDQYGLADECINFAVGIEQPQEHFDYFPDCMHDSIQQLLDQKRSAVLAREVMDRLTKQAEQMQLNQQPVTDDDRRKQAIMERLRQRLANKKNDASTNK
jgi:hypothetical protein